MEDYNIDDEVQSNSSNTNADAEKLKKLLVAETDFFGETKIDYKETLYTWVLNDFQTLIKLHTHLDTKSFAVCDDSGVECFLSLDISDSWMSVHVNFCQTVPSYQKYEINLHVINEENLSSLNRYLYAKDISKGQKFSFKKFLSLEKEELDNFLVNGNLFLWCEIDHVESSFSFRNTEIDMDENEMSKDIPKLLQEQLLTDVTLVVGEREFQAHKCILAVRSPVFLAMFQANMKENQENKVILNDDDPDCLQQLLEYVYTDKVDNIQKDTEKLLEMADKYDVKGLKLLCAQELSNLLDTDSAIHTLICADRCNVQKLKESVLTFIKSNIQKVLKSETYGDVLAKYPNLLKEVFLCKSPSAKKQKLVSSSEGD